MNWKQRRDIEKRLRAIEHTGTRTSAFTARADWRTVHQLSALSAARTADERSGYMSQRRGMRACTRRMRVRITRSA